MDNDAVITQLQALIDQLTDRRQELQVLQDNPGGPLVDRMNRQAQVYERLSSINVRIYNLQLRLHERQLAAQLGTAVPALDPTKVAVLTQALNDVSQSIVATGDFQAAIALASTISDAASKAQSAVA